MYKRLWVGQALEQTPKRARQEFDYLVGGDWKVPPLVKTKDYVITRVEECSRLQEKIEAPPIKGDLTQRMPKHMRRRQMSHDTRRLPRVYRNMIPPRPEKTKRPSRKFRRRPTNCLNEYNRRQKDRVWLETHIWHAKRFHMVPKWGYKLGNAPTNKGFRANYRAIRQHCLLLDMSYYNCIQLEGTSDNLLEGLRQHTSTDCGTTFESQACKTGRREGSTFFYERNSYPFGAIGPVKFMWKPTESKDDKTLWIWVHPAVHEEIKTCLLHTFSLKKIEKSVSASCESYEMLKLEKKNVPYERAPKYQNNNTGVKMCLLKDTLNRFRLIGPLANSVLHESLKLTEKPITATVKVEQDDVAIIDDNEEVTEIKEVNWQQKYNYSQEKGEVQFFEVLNDCYTVLPTNLITSLVIYDPRLHLPARRQKAVQEPGNAEVMKLVCSNYVDQSLIWNESVRDEVTRNKLSTTELNKIRSKNLVGGYSINQQVINSDPRLSGGLPILLVYRAGVQNGDSCKSQQDPFWDVIIPAGYGMPVWESFIKNGAHAGGLRDMERTLFEWGDLKDTLPPDSKAGKTEICTRETELKQIYFNLPPNKRPNYRILGAKYPFRPAWEELVKEWLRSQELSNINTYFVLRDQNILEIIMKQITNVKLKRPFEEKELQGENLLNSIVPIKIICKGKGSPEENAMICLPSKEDLEKLGQDKLYQGPFQPSKTDKNDKLRRDLKEKHKKLLSSLKRKRRKTKSEGQEQLVEKPEELIRYKEEMEKLWLPDVDTSISDYCCRRTVGFVVCGGFSYSQSCGIGLSYISYLGLLELLRSNSSVVLFRNVNSNQFRFAEISIIS